MSEKQVKFEELKGKILKDIKCDKYHVIFFTENGEQYKLYHEQYCCEDVYVEDICGDLKDLIGNEILIAEEVSVSNYDLKDDEKINYLPPSDAQDSYTWTFYKLATINGYVTIRFFGSSNGCYAESASLFLFEEN